MSNPKVRQFGPKPLKAGGILFDKYQYLGLRVINKTGSDIAADKLVAVVGFDVPSGRPKIVSANADTATHGDVWVALGAIANNAEGVVYKGGQSAATLDTSGATTVGDPIYVSATAGGFAHTKSQNHAFIVGWSTVKDASVGAIYWHIGPAMTFGNSNNDTV